MTMSMWHFMSVEGGGENIRGTKGRVLCGPGMSGEFKLNVGLRQRSAVSPMLFVAVVELISRKIGTKDILRKILYADDLAIVAVGEVQLIEWKDMSANMD